MSAAFKNIDFLSLPDKKSRNSLPRKGVRTSVPISFYTAFCCRQNTVNEIFSLYNLSKQALLTRNSFSKVIGISGEGGIGKSHLVNEFEKKISVKDSSHILRIDFSDKNNFIFTREIDRIRDLIEKKIKASNKKGLPLIVILEDLHWYEAKEKDKIEKLIFAYSGELPFPFSLSVIFLVTFRNTSFSFRFFKYDTYEQIGLKPLDSAESLKFISSSRLADKQKLSKPVKEKIVLLSAGIPFYIEEFLKTAALKKDLDVITDPPDSIAELLEYKLQFIKPELINILEIIAAWDGFIESDLLKNICSKLHIHIPSADILLGTGLIRAEKYKGTEGYLFLHDIYKDFILNRTDKLSKIIYHKAFARLLQKDIDDSDHSLFRLFYHFRNAAETDTAFSYLEQYILSVAAKREFEAVLKHIDELILYYSGTESKKFEYRLLKIRALRELLRRDEMGTELARIEKPINKHKNSELYLKYLYLLEEYHLLSNDFTKAFRIIRKGLKLSKVQNNVYMQAEFQFLLTRTLNTNGKVKQSLKESSMLLKLSSRTADKKHYYWARYFTAIGLQSMHNIKESGKIIDDAIQLSGNESEYLFYTIFSQAKAKYYFRTGNYEKFVSFTRQQYRSDLNTKDVHHSVTTLINLSDGLILLHKFSEAETILNGLVKFVQKNNSTLFLKRILERLLNFKMRMKSYAESRMISDRLLKLYDKNDYNNLLALHLNLIEINFFLDNLEKGREHYVHAVYYAKKINSISTEAIVHYNFGYACYLAGTILQAENYILRSYNKVKKYLSLDFNFDINFSLAELYLAKGELKRSKKILDSISGYFENVRIDEQALFHSIFDKLLLNSFDQEKYEGFLNSKDLYSFMTNKSVDDLSKIKIVYFILMISQKEKVSLLFEQFKKIKRFIKTKDTKNKIILFYLNQISSYEKHNEDYIA